MLNVLPLCVIVGVGSGLTVTFTAADVVPQVPSETTTVYEPDALAV